MPSDLIQELKMARSRHKGDHSRFPEKWVTHPAKSTHKQWNFLGKAEFRHSRRCSQRLYWKEQYKTFEDSYSRYRMKTSIKRRETGTSDDLEIAIQNSREMLTWSADWDGQDSPPFSETTWGRTVDFLRKHAVCLRDLMRLKLPTPRILPGPNGSIDLHWKTTNYELLINVPADTNVPATFYGDDYGNQVLRGSFDMSTPQLGVLAWFLNHQ